MARRNLQIKIKEKNKKIRPLGLPKNMKLLIIIHIMTRMTILRIGVTSFTPRKLLIERRRSRILERRILLSF